MTMDDLERKLEDAAAEVRRTTQSATPPSPRTAPRRRPDGWIAFATAFAVVLAFGLVSLLGGAESPGDIAAPATTTTLIARTTLSPPTTDTEPTTPPEKCSATGVELPLEPEGLPAPVLDKWSAIVEAVSSCHLEELTGLAEPGFITSFGGGDETMFEEWEEGDSGQLGTVLRILGMSWAIQEIEDGPDIYSWPAAFVYDHWEEIPQELLDELLAIYSQDELDQLSGFGSYAGWRTGISEDGEWLFYVAGD